MKSLKLGLRIWIGITSIISFLGGWALLSHSGKPVALFPSTGSNVQAASPAQQPAGALAPIPSLDSLIQGSQSAGNNSALQPLPSLQQGAPRSFFPRMTTRGS